VDWLVASGHKMCGPTGIGFLWGKYDVLESMPPWQVCIWPHGALYRTAGCRTPPEAPSVRKHSGMWIKEFRVWGFDTEQE